MERWAEVLGEATVRSLVLLALGAVAAWLARRGSAALRHHLRLAVLTGMLLMPAASWLLPGLKLPALPEPSAAAIVMPQLFIESGAPSPAVMRTRTPQSAPSHWRWWLGLVLAAGSVVFGARLAMAIVKTTRLARSSRPIDDPAVRDAVAGLSLGHAFARVPDVCEANVSTPLVAGLIRPRILLPPTWRLWSPAKLEAVLAHESAHIARGDVFSRLVSAINRCIFWFHPGAWWLARQMEILAEEASDDLSLIGRGDSHEYARMLVELAGEAASGGLPRAAIAMARPCSVPRRVDRLLESSHQPSAGLSPAGRMLTFLAAIPLVYAVAATTLTPSQGVQPASHGPLQLLQGKGWTNAVLFVGMKVTPAQAEQLEARLRVNPNDLEARITLIAHYYWQTKEELRPAHVFWWIEHYPASELFDFSGAQLGPHSPPEVVDRAERLWIDQASRYFMNARVLTNAARALEWRRPDRAAEYLTHARQLEPDNPVLAQRLAGLYVSAVQTNAFRPSGLSGQLSPERLSFIGGAEAALESLSDAQVLLVAGERLRPGRFFRGPAEIEARFAPLAERLLQKAYSLGAQPLPEPQPRPAPGPARVEPPPVAELRLVEHVAPIYPPLAKQARIQGKVVMDITVDTDGKVVNIKVVMGHPLLVQAAMDAAKQWVYERPANQSIVRATSFFTLDQ